MSVLRWNESTSSVGISKIDLEHQKIFAIINRLGKAMKKGRGGDVLVETLYELERYSEYHFRLEEFYFNTYNYPQAKDHKKEHKSFEDNLLNFRKLLETGALTSPIKLMYFLQNWWLNHIIEVDMRYAKFFKESGIDIDAIEESVMIDFSRNFEPTNSDTRR